MLWWAPFSEVSRFWVPHVGDKGQGFPQRVVEEMRSLGLVLVMILRH